MIAKSRLKEQFKNIFFWGFKEIGIPNNLKNSIFINHVLSRLVLYKKVFILRYLQTGDCVQVNGKQSKNFFREFQVENRNRTVFASASVRNEVFAKNQKNYVIY